MGTTHKRRVIPIVLVVAAIGLAAFMLTMLFTRSSTQELRDAIDQHKRTIATHEQTIKTLETQIEELADNNQMLLEQSDELINSNEQLQDINAQLQSTNSALNTNLQKVTDDLARTEVVLEQAQGNAQAQQEIIAQEQAMLNAAIETEQSTAETYEDVARITRQIRELVRAQRDSTN